MSEHYIKAVEIQETAQLRCTEPHTPCVEITLDYEVIKCVYTFLYVQETAQLRCTEITFQMQENEVRLYFPIRLKMV